MAPKKAKSVAATTPSSSTDTDVQTEVTPAKATAKATAKKAAKASVDVQIEAPPAKATAKATAKVTARKAAKAVASAKSVPSDDDQTEASSDEVIVKAPVKTPVKNTPKKVVGKKTKAIPVEEPVEDVVGEEVIEICQDEVCTITVVEQEEVEEQEYDESEEQEEYDEDEEDEELEEFGEDEDDGYVGSRQKDVLSPVRVTGRATSNRERSPRMADVLSPISNLKPRAKSHYDDYNDLTADMLRWGESEMLDVIFDKYENLRAVDVLTWTYAVDSVPYVFYNGGVLCSAEEAEEAKAVDTLDDIDSVFDIFECRSGVLAFSPANDIDFGEDEVYASRLTRCPGYVYIVLVLSSGENGGDIRAVDEFYIQGKLRIEDYETIKDRPDYRNRLKRTTLVPIDVDDAEAVDTANE